jgi:hypothetical protein
VVFLFEIILHKPQIGVIIAKMDNCAPRHAKFRCSEAIGQAVAAYHALMVGQTRVRVRHGDSEVEYDKRNIPALKNYIMSLHQSCGGAESAAVLGIPQRRAPAHAVFSEQTLAGSGCISGIQQSCNPCEGCE